MANEIQVWNKVMSTDLAMPGVKVERNQFLKSKLGRYCTEAQVETALSYSPLKVLSRQDIDRIANSVISSHIKQVTALSAAAGVPGGFAMAATIPGDIAQYYYHVFNLSQKLAYLYGYPNLLDEDGNATDDTINLLTLFTGAMMGAAVANNGSLEFAGSKVSFDCEGSDAELQAIFKRRVGGNENGLVAADTTNYIAGQSGVQLPGNSSGDVRLNLKQDITNGVTAKNLGYWVFNPSSNPVKLRMWVYQVLNSLQVGHSTVSVSQKPKFITSKLLISPIVVLT